MLAFFGSKFLNSNSEFVTRLDKNKKYVQTFKNRRNIYYSFIFNLKYYSDKMNKIADIYYYYNQ